MATKENRSWWLEQIINLVSEFGQLPGKAISRCQFLSIFGWSEGRQRQSDRLFWFAVRMSLVSLLGGHIAMSMKIIHTWTVGVTSEADEELSSFSWHGFRKRAVWVSFLPSNSKSKEWERIRNVSLESSSHMLEATRRIHDAVQSTGRKENLRDN